ncbi:MAG: OmpA family protein, partial [Myxococcales bacterium]|nr:OmpA family protein [Myxococcales bacterium]
MKRTVAALAAGLLPGLVAAPSTALAVERTSTRVVEPAEAATEPTDEASTDDADEEASASTDAGAESASAEPGPPRAPKPPAGEAAASGGVSIGGGGAKAGGKAEGKRGRRGKKGDDAEAPAEIDCQVDPKACERAEAKQRPWIRRWEASRNLVELGVFGGLLRPSDEHDLYDPATRPQDPLWRFGPDVGVRAAYFPLKPLGIEAEFSANPTRVRTITNDFAFVYGFRGHLVLQVPVTRIVPFLLGGYGLMGVRSHILILGNDVDPAFHYGGGVKMFINKHLVARVEARQIVSATAAQQDSGTAHLQVLAGLSYTLGRKKYVPPPKVVPVDPDRDKDGILNEADECPDVAGVEPTGCPDTDGDGFIDKVDACPEVPGVEPDGCPLKDSDGDKILDVEDDCVFEPETYNGVDDDDGCPDEVPPELIVFKGTLQGIEFDFGKATIRPESKPVLDDVAAKLQKFPGVRVTIVGHTDNVGTPEANLDLSKRRAESVKQYLVDAGVDGSRIETDGKGDTEPVDPTADQNAKETQAKNRRIVFDIIANEPTEVRPLSGKSKDPDAEVVGEGGSEAGS